MHYCAVVCITISIIAHISENEKYFHKIIQEYLRVCNADGNDTISQEYLRIFNKISRGENVNG